MRATALLVLGAMIQGCAGRSPPAELAAPVGEVIPAPYTPQSDAAFLDAMLSHHRTAIRMARHVVESGSDPDVLRIAGDILATKLREVREMRRLRPDVAEAPRHVLAADPRMQADMNRLRELSGPALDRAFLRAMIAHRAGGIQLAHRAMPYLSAPVRGLADRIVDGQAEQTGDMRERLIALTGSFGT